MACMCVFCKNLCPCCHNEVTKEKGTNTAQDEERHPEARLSKKALSGVQNPSFSLASWFVCSHPKAREETLKLNEQFNKWEREALCMK